MVEIKRSDGKYGWRDLTREVKTFKHALLMAPNPDLITHVSNVRNVYRGLSEGLTRGVVKPRTWEITPDRGVLDRHFLGMPLAKVIENARELASTNSPTVARQVKSNTDHLLRLSKAMDLIFEDKHRAKGSTNIRRIATDLQNYHDQLYAGKVIIVNNTTPVRVNINHALLHWVITELIGNAKKAIDLKAQPGTGQITIKSREDKTRHYIDVQDNGIGMNLHQLNALFQGHSGFEAQGAEGSGKVLPKIKEVLDTQGARLAVRSIPGEGTTFTIEIPKTKREKRKTTR